MKLTLLGQAGVWITLNNGLDIVIDPYLSDSIHIEKGSRFIRQIPIVKTWCDKDPDIILLTHNHGDHLDHDTIDPWLNKQKLKQIVGPYPVYSELYSLWPGKHNIMVAREGVEVSLCDVLIRVVPAAHETEAAVGYCLEAEGKVIYFSGDTLFTRRIPNFFVGKHIDLMFVCINGFGNNMNAVDAARLSEILRPELVIPVHWDMFQAYGADPSTFVEALGNTCSSKILSAYSSISI